MASLGLEGPWALTAKNIDENFTRKEPGNYALGYMDANSVFIVKYVGRSDTDLNDRLHKHLGESYPLFKAKYASSPKTAFEKECQNWHDFGGLEGKLDNKIHPGEPTDASWKCPVNGCDYSANPKKKSVW